MKTRAPLALALVAGLPAAAPAQEVFIVNYSWAEVISGTTIPAPAPNSDLSPGEGALIRVSVEARFNGSSAIGQTTTYSSPPPGGVGTVRGLASVIYDLVGNFNASTAAGTWSGLSGPIPGAPFNAGLTAGTPQPSGSSIHAFGGAQLVTPGATANGSNSNVQVFRGVWQPSSYVARYVQFLARASVAVPTGEQNAVLLAYGLGTDPGTGQNYDLFVGKNIPTLFGNGALVSVGIPAPGGVAAVGLLGLCGAAHRRRSPAH